MADALDNLALNYTKTLVAPRGGGRGGAEKTKELRRLLAPILSKYLRGSELTSGEQAMFNKTRFRGKSPAQVFREVGYTATRTQDLLKAQDAFRAAMKEKKPVTEEQTASAQPTEPTEPTEPTGSTGQQGTAGAGSGSAPPSGNDMEIPEYAKSVYKGLDDKPSTDSAPTTRRAMLDKARDTLKGDTYQLGSSSYLTAAREMKKPTPFKQRTDEQVAARNLVVRDRMAREQGKTYNPKATALDKAKSRMRDLATSQKGAQQFFADTGVSPKGVRAISGERMPERRRTYEAPRNPNVVRTETPSERFEGGTNVSYRSFSPDEVNELEKRRRRNR